MEPKGSTHYHDVHGIRNYYKYTSYLHHFIIDHEPVLCYKWMWWNGKEWQDESSVNSINFVRI